MIEIPLPRAGMTLLPPWWCFILWAGKRIENRSRRVAARCGTWRGWIALGASKHYDADLAEEIIADVRALPSYMWWGPARWTSREMRNYAGHLVAVAELLDVRDNGAAPTDPWAESGEWAFVLGRVYEIEPVPCSGGRGIHALGGCAGCGQVGAIEEPHAPLQCRRCKASTPRSELRRPALRAVRLFGPDGALCPIA